MAWDHECRYCGTGCGCQCSGCIGMSCCHFLTHECREAQGADEFEYKPDDDEDAESFA